MARPILTRIRTALTNPVRDMYRVYLCRVFGMDIGKGSQVALTARLDKTNPRGIHIGEDTVVAFEAAILTHDFVNRRHLEVRIGKECFIGARSMIYPGVTIGDNCIISACAIVMKDVPPRSVVSGNPGRVVETNITTGRLGHRVRSAA